MNKLMKVVAASVCAVSLSAVAAEEVATEKPELEEEETPIFEAGFDLDFFSAYVWRNAVQTDDMVIQPCVWADLTYFDPFYVGFSIWQNYDLSSRRDAYRYGLNETDYNIHAGVTAWESEEGEMSLGFELGHEWYSYHGVRDESRDDSPDASEIYVKATFDNPFVNVYGQASYMYRDFGSYLQGMHYEIGFNREYELTDTLSLGADWNVNFGDGRYLSFLYGGTAGEWYRDEDEGWCNDYDSNVPGIGGTTFKVYMTWQITENISLGGTLAYTGILNGSYRSDIGEQGDDYGFCRDGASYPRDLLWGGLSLKFSY